MNRQRNMFQVKNKTKELKVEKSKLPDKEF